MYFFPSSVKSNKRRHTAGSRSSHSKSVLVVRKDGENEYSPCGINFLFNVLQKAFGICPATQMYVNTIHSLFVWVEGGVCEMMTSLASCLFLVGGESFHLQPDGREEGLFQFGIRRTRSIRRAWHVSSQPSHSFKELLSRSLHVPAGDYLQIACNKCILPGQFSKQMK